MAAMPKGEKRLLCRVAALPMLALAAGCGLCDSTELSRVTSDGGGVEAVVMERDCGATTGFNYRVHVVPEGGRTEDRNRVFLADKVDNLRVAWQDNEQLLITYDEARIFEFTNFSYVSGRTIGIMERVTDDCTHPPPAIIHHS